MHAYRAYDDPSFLQIAMSTWNLFDEYSITAGDADVGRHPLKNIPIRSSCNGGMVHGFLSNYLGS